MKTKSVFSFISWIYDILYILHHNEANQLWSFNKEPNLSEFSNRVVILSFQLSRSVFCFRLFGISFRDMAKNRDDDLELQFETDLNFSQLSASRYPGKQPHFWQNKFLFLWLFFDYEYSIWGDFYLYGQILRGVITWVHNKG